MRYIELLTSGIALLGLAFLPSGCDSANDPSVTTERIIAQVEAPSSVTTNESFEVTGRAFGQRSDDSRVPVDSVKLFFEGTLAGSSPGGSALSIDIDSSMTSVGGADVMAKAFKTVRGELLSSEASQDIKVIEAPPQASY